MTETIRKVINNTFFVLSEKLLNRTLSFLLTIYLARFLGTADFGKLTFAMSFVSLFLVISDFGISMLSLRDISSNIKDGANYLGKMSTLKAVLSLFTFFIICSAIQFMKVESDTKILVYFMAGYFLFESIGTFLATVFQAHERMEFLLLFSTLEKIFLFILCFVALQTTYNLKAVSAAYLLSGFFYLLFINFKIYISFFKPLYSFNLKFWKNALKDGLPFAIINLLSMVYFNIDIIMISKMKGEIEAGWYGVSYKLFFTIATLAGAFLTAVFPLLSRSANESAEQLKSVYDKSFKILLGLGIPLSIGGVILSRKIILFLFGSHYENSISSFRIFSFIIVLGFLNSLSAYSMAAVQKQSVTAKILFITTVLNIILNYILIPSYGGSGAAFATLVCEIILFALLLTLGFSSFHPSVVSIISAFKAFAASLCMGAIVYFLKSWPLILTIFIGMSSYGALLWLFNYFNNEDKAILKKLFLEKTRWVSA